MDFYLRTSPSPFPPFQITWIGKCPYFLPFIYGMWADKSHIIGYISCLKSDWDIWGIDALNINWKVCGDVLMSCVRQTR